MTIANVEMAEAWDGPEGDHWTEQAERYESIGPEYWNRLAEAMAVQVDDDILDVGCGTGRSTRDAARIATSGSAVGVDLSRRMLERAREIARAEGLTNVRFERADAQVHPFPAAAFDVVVSSFGAMFFADAAAAFTNLARSMRPGGRLGVLAWQELAANEWLCEIRAALAAGRDLPTPPPGMPGPFGLAEPQHANDVLAQAGFVDVAVEPVHAPMRFGADVADAFAFVSTLGMVRGLSHDLDADTAEGCLEALRQTLAEHETPDGVVFSGSAWLITGRASLVDRVERSQ
jgi:SAM-dependent methyltransferase